MRRQLVLALALASAVSAATHATASPVLDRVRAAGTLRCGVVTELADYAHDDKHGPVPSLQVDLCRALAAATLGGADHVSLVGMPDESDGIEALGEGRIDVLMGATPSLAIARGRHVRFGRPVFYDAEGLLAGISRGIATTADLSGKQLCFIASQPGHEAVASALARQGVKPIPFPFEEIGEMEAAFVGGRCQVMAASMTQLAESRSAFGSRGAEFMMLPWRFTIDPLAPVVAEDDPAWLDIVDWTMSALIQAEISGITQANVTVDREGDDPIVRQLQGREHGIAPILGLSDDWARRAIAAVGNYGEVFDRDVGQRSGLRLSRGPNAVWTRGGLLVPLAFE